MENIKFPFKRGKDDFRLLSKNNVFYKNRKLGLSANQRLLRTTRIIVLPVFTNINLITNSFDVIHSWFIPGLGVKLDCVPGRSTHHSIYIKNTGFYYGQCAEICGRYHHHMPIRICVVPFEHFILWWVNYGYPIFLSKNTPRDRSNRIGEYNW